MLRRTITINQHNISTKSDYNAITSSPNNNNHNTQLCLLLNKSKSYMIYVLIETPITILKHLPLPNQTTFSNPCLFIY